MIRPNRLTAAHTGLALLLASSMAVAHPSPLHGGFVAGMAHPLVGLDHLMAIAAVGFWAGQLGGRARWLVPLAFVAAMMVGGLVTAFGLTLPAMEPLIAASVLVFGLLVATGARFPLVVSAVLVVAFALFHGAAHMAEAPIAADATAYVAGFVVGTAVLHVIGLIAALATRTHRVAQRLAGIPIALAGAWLVAQPLL